MGLPKQNADNLGVPLDMLSRASSSADVQMAMDEPPGDLILVVPTLPRPHQDVDDDQPVVTLTVNEIPPSPSKPVDPIKSDAKPSDVKSPKKPAAKTTVKKTPTKTSSTTKTDVEPKSAVKPQTQTSKSPAPLKSALKKPVQASNNLAVPQ